MLADFTLLQNNVLHQEITKPAKEQNYLVTMMHGYVITSCAAKCMTTINKLFFFIFYFYFCNGLTCLEQKYQDSI